MATQTLGVLVILAVFMCSKAGAQENGIAAITTGEVLVLDCMVEDQSGDLDHEVVWFLDDIQVSNASRLILRDLNHTHHGSNITCYNHTDIIHTRIIHYRHKLILEVGKTLILNCTTDPTADTNITWHQNNRTARTDWNITDLDNVTSQLRIPNVTLDDIGLYSCRSSGGDTIKAFNVSVGLIPRSPSSIDCFGCNQYNFTCEWQNIPDTHLPTEVTFEYREVRRSEWKECPKYLNHGCFFRYGEHSVFRLNINNALGSISVDVPEYDPQEHLTVPAPVITRIEAISSYQVDIHWTISTCGINPSNLKFKVENTDNDTGVSYEIDQGYATQARLEKLNANTEYCFRVTGRLDGAYGHWSEKSCTRTLPTVPNVNFDEIQYKDLETEKDEGLRDIDLSWKLVQIDSSEPFQGISHFSLNVRLNEPSTDEVDGNLLSLKDRNFTYDLKGQNDYRLEQDTFNYTIPGLSKYKNYTITLSAVNPADSRSTTLKIHAQVPMKKAGFVVIAAVVVPLVMLLILALLAFGFQRLKNNSKPIPEPVYHRYTGNVKPTHIEHEVFDELPAVSKEKERQMLVNLSRESAKSQQEDKGYRTSSSSTSSGVGSDTTSLEMGVVEKVPLLQIQEGSVSSMNKSPYSLLSELTPTFPRLQMAPDAMETDLDSLSPTGGHYSSTDEGISLGGSSFYNHLGSFKDASQPTPYYSMCGQVPGRVLEPPNDSGYMASGSQQSSNVGCDNSLPRASDGDDEASLPSSPATTMSAYYSYLSTATNATSRDASSGYCEPYVIAAGMPGSPPMRAPPQNLPTIRESPNHYKPHTPSGDHSIPKPPCDSGYVDNTAVCDSGYVANSAICIGIAQTGVPEDISNPSSTQSSPEHAVIIHKNPRRNQDASDEYLDNTYFTSPATSPLNNRSLPVYAANNNLSPSGASGYSCAPQSRASHDSPSKSNLQSMRPKDNAGYITCEQVQQVPMPPAVVDTPEQQFQDPAHFGRGLPTLSGNAGGYVPVSQMSIPVQSDPLPADTTAQKQASRNGSGSTDLDTKMLPLVPAADLRLEPSVDPHESNSHLGYQLHERIPANNLESISENSLSSEGQNAGLKVCSNPVASNVGPSRTGGLPISTNGGYVDKDMTNVPSRTLVPQPLELNNNGYVRIP